MKLQSKDNSTSSISEIRLGYFGRRWLLWRWSVFTNHYVGICLSVSSKPTCQSSPGKSPDTVLQLASATSLTSTALAGRSKSMVSVALMIQSKILLGLIAGAGVLFAISLVFFGLLKRHFNVRTGDNTIASKRRHLLRKAAFSTMWLSIAFSLVSAMSINQTTNALDYVTQADSSTVRITTGKTLNVLQWLAFSFSVLFAIGMVNIIRREGGMIVSTGSTKSGYLGNLLDTHGVPLPPPPPPPPLLPTQPPPVAN